LQVRGTNNEYLLAATYGRGLYRINIANLPRTVVNSTVTNPSKVSKLKVLSITPNPVSVSGVLAVTYEAENAGEIRAEVYDETGKQIKTFGVAYVQAGKGTLEGSVSGLPQGVYFMVITGNGDAITQKFVVN
jgi:hypothetical protein